MHGAHVPFQQSAPYSMPYPTASSTIIRNITMTSIGLRPALLFLSSAGVNTTASISARKLSNGTTRSIISSGSPFADIAASRLSASKNPSCPIGPTSANLVVISQTRTNWLRRLFFEAPKSLVWHVLPRQQPPKNRRDLAPHRHLGSDPSHERTGLAGRRRPGIVRHPPVKSHSIRGSRRL